MSSRYVWGDHPATIHIEAAIVDFLVEALGATNMVAQPEIAVGELDRRPRASSAEQVATRTRRLESAACSVEVFHEETYFPGDVNEPASDHHYIHIVGIRRDGPTLTVHVHVGDRKMAVEGNDDLVAEFASRFGETT